MSQMICECGAISKFSHRIKKRTKDGYEITDVFRHDDCMYVTKVSFTAHYKSLKDKIKNWLYFQHPKQIYARLKIAVLYENKYYGPDDPRNSFERRFPQWKHLYR